MGWLTGSTRKQASKQPSKRAAKQASRQASEQASKHASKHASKQASSQPSKLDGLMVWLAVEFDWCIRVWGCVLKYNHIEARHWSDVGILMMLYGCVRFGE